MKSALLITGLVSGLLCAAVNAAGTEQVCNSAMEATTPSREFSENADGTLLHIVTGLTWKRCVEGSSGNDCSAGSATNLTWQQALQLAENSRFAGFDDWRLPTIKELDSIVERRCARPTANLDIFPNTPALAVFWTSSFYVNPEGRTLLIKFDGGRSAALWRGYPAGYARLVRSSDAD